MKITDKMRLDWLEKKKGEGLWASANPTDGSIQVSDGLPDDSFYPKLREAIDAAIRQDAKGKR